MKPRERRELILRELLGGDGTRHVEELSRKLSVSSSTIRRDLDLLWRDGHVVRTYGGALLGPSEEELNLRQRELSYPREKDAIARRAASRVSHGETILLDAGTTTGRLAWHLRDRKNLTVVTNGLNTIATLLESSDEIAVIVLGGHLRRTNQAIVGSMTEDNLLRISADKVFLGADAFDPHQGIASRKLKQSYLKGGLAQRGRDLFVLADSSKLSPTRLHYWTPLTQAFTLITDPGITTEQLAALNATGHVNVEIAEYEGDVRTISGGSSVS